MYIWLFLCSLCLVCELKYAVDPAYKVLPANVMRVTTIKLEPYMMENPDYAPDNGQPEYIGYIPDLMHSLSEVAGFNYIIIPVADGEFGFKQSDGSWNGMIGKLYSRDAEVAAAPMYATQQRSKIVDFTDPFMNVQAALLFRRPPAETNFNIHSAEDLLHQSEIQFGTLNHGVLIRAFRQTNSTALRIMWRKMESFTPSTFTLTNQEGIDRVRSEKYAFIIPNTIGEYVSMQPPCDLISVDRFLMNRGYCLAVQKGSAHLPQLNTALDILRQTGRLDELYRKWWLLRSQCHKTGTRVMNMYSAAYASPGNSAKSYHYDTPYVSLLLCLYILCYMYVLPA